MKSKNICFGGIQKTTLIDFPGMVACTLFVNNCNFRCPFCQNPDLAIGKAKCISNEEIMNFLDKRKGLIEGVCISGGEPTIYDNLVDFTKKIKEIGYMVKIDTNGSRPEIIEKFIRKKTVDYIAMDLKAPLEKYSIAAGVKVDTNALRKSISLILEGKIDYEFRTTVVPKIILREDIEKICFEIRGAKKYFLQQFVNSTALLDKSFSEIIPYPKSVLEEMAKVASKYVKNVEVRAN
ncbi:MAG: anaerobic ribonucleoside-triphosphate reductase activating protein [Candidatus Diapherotrites archaeon]|nr:anaerobic ribonucleoside-triphosphate reductase activating protein [Candidatus Diapherotrites archaeon]